MELKVTNVPNKSLNDSKLEKNSKREKKFQNFVTVKKVLNFIKMIFIQGPGDVVNVHYFSLNIFLPLQKF